MALFRAGGGCGGGGERAVVASCGKMIGECLRAGERDEESVRTDCGVINAERSDLRCYCVCNRGVCVPSLIIGSCMLGTLRTACTLHDWLWHTCYAL